MSSDTPTSPPTADRAYRRVVFCFALVLVVLVGVLVVSWRNLNRSVATSDWVNHTHALINEIDALQPLLASAHGQLTRYLLTSDPRDQAAYQENFADVG